MAIALTHLGSVTQGNIAGSATQVITTVAAVPAGSLICVLIQDKNTTTTAPTLTDSVGNTYVLAQQQVRGSVTGTGYGCIYYAKNASALPSGGTITATRPTANGVFVASAFYATGIDTANPLDTAVTAGTFAPSSASPSPTITSGTPSVAGELFVALLTPSGAVTYTEDTADGWTNTPPNAVKSGSAGTDGAVNGAVQINAGVGALTYTPGISASSAWSIGVVAFKAAVFSTLNVTASQTTNAVTQSTATQTLVKETGAQTTSAVTQSSAVQVVQTINISGAQLIAPTTNASTIKPLVQETSAQTLAAATQSSDIHVGSLPGQISVDGAQTTLAALQTATLYVPIQANAAQQTQAAGQSGSIILTPWTIHVDGAQTLLTPSQTSFITVPTGTRRIRLARQADGNMGVRISKAGYDVWTNPVDNTQLIFNSDWGMMMQVYLTGSFLHRTGSDLGQTVTDTIAYAGLGYTPFCEFFVQPLAHTTDYVAIMEDNMIFNRTSAEQLVDQLGLANQAGLQIGVSASQIKVTSFTPNSSGSSLGYPTRYKVYYCIYRRQAS